MNKAIVIISSVLLFISLISCGNSSKSNDEIEVGITIYRYDDNFISFMRRNIETMLNGKAKFVMNDSENDQVKQNDQVDAAIQREVDALAINLVDPASASFMINKIKPTGIPVIFFNKEPSKEDMMLYDKAWYVGTLSEESGNIQGDIVVKAWTSNPAWDKNGDGKIQYVLLKGEAGHPDAEARTERIKAVLTDNGINIEQLDEQTANWDILQAQTATDSWIEKYGNDIEFIFSNNDAMALGALKSIQKQGYNIGDSNKFIPIVGVDAIPEVIEEIKKGTVVGTVLQSPKDQAKAIVDMVLNVASGKDVLNGTEYKLDDVKAVRVPYRAITLENIDESAEAYK
ncbi:galactose/glucose ABC transporter substrate-binding protein MglB [Brachyspira hyodysenteriae]|uniref:D-galactose/methyl-galactoside binding periplasmic protein MglB n=2 Tax=Brachyspira hyodysenteriae TaxID=159 RepID=A0A3B6VMA7_BRAHW|nr:galactose ABC transporter substrate-binding protein [Brachyspira hyodysenteriae]ACN85006.1 galactose/glucose-binding protein [Brachyspira hyodysenteriae WA1]ANN62960.1 galactose ABC transporter substrate-binding protein [Brachyspira hyodysenteriae ATCC 27164]AUJ50725.1 galactose ABC transporter substrate-binding protein [Brachyspira hyodysenteriae]KLI17913.1 methyl-galactoside ABC transporter substrate-binding protein [Brachyspira hyodysenteriae]KLI19647.1 methyl-galactoside ABC transporter